MSYRNKRTVEASFDEMLMIKRRARERLVDAVRSANRESLELAAKYVKTALRGNAPIPRPQRFSCLANEK
ncbi:hypothetical protein [Pseudomonas sp. CMR5c]|uniref:hypothetical protein n=1 Tax=Pseudomonas sp. CMR5c TaxID=658630 RepID=UPI000F5785BD|nr:hypothetical protein [Pseudomonas sp. CMR5c]